MISHSIARYIRTSPRKIRQVINLIRGKNVADALSILAHLNKRAAGPVTKVVKSAAAGALAKSPSLSQTQLCISKIAADEGPMWKRYRAAAMGRSVKIRKRTSHIMVELDTNGTQG